MDQDLDRRKIPFGTPLPCLPCSGPERHRVRLERMLSTNKIAMLKAFLVRRFLKEAVILLDGSDVSNLPYVKNARNYKGHAR